MPVIKLLIDRKSQYFKLYRLGVIIHAENNSFKNIINSKIKRAIAVYHKKSILKIEEQREVNLVPFILVHVKGYNESAN